ncbi:MAG TPA: 16S rRNA (uracil(1498)-N(3))-methyltransferase [Brevundimonas sp.]|uniref:16S rRNA (uracil(1498)-N(3))-methyltransferase n=1 Tax=Brevundimonas sp. TaxID=1871086 RepID=UPI0026265EA4|nr:16S rRNA (uracil(1498)-N(3))-methyltransferase [Brevundimonas sp.]HRO32632.1 16S rRNA (uracil(1498)-N(3))-methyltransferase [Brevundimonas sp.]
MIRLHVPQPLSSGGAVAPSLDQSRYLTQVMRLKAGDALLVFNGADGEWRATVAEVLKKGVILRADEQVRPQTAAPEVELLMAVVKKAPLEFAVEKATELGVARIRLVRTRRTTTEHLRLDRLDAIAIESAEQCGRLDVPPVDDPVKLDALLDRWDGSRRLMFCDETGGPDAAATLAAFNPPPSGEGDPAQQGGGGSEPERAAAPSTASRSPSPDGGGLPQPWSILIGPEGGFAPEERARLLDLPQAVPVSLGPRILRADTAAAAALTLWQSALGDWTQGAS